MTHRIAIFPLFIYLLVTWGCAGGFHGVSPIIIDKQDLSTIELEKVEAIKVLMEAKDLVEDSHKVITQVNGVSTDTCYLGGRVADTVDRDDAVEQVKIQAVRAGGNAITNLVCVFDHMRWGYCGKVIECTADVLCKDPCKKPIRPYIDPSLLNKCDTGMESCD